MTPLLNLYDYYLNDVPGCTFTLATRALRMAAQEFCERTRAWKMYLPAQATIANQAKYQFAPGADIRIVRTIRASIDGREVDILRAASQGASGIVVHDERSYTVCPAPAAGQQVVFHCAVAPSNTATSIDEALYDRYARAIAVGAKAELFGMKRQPFSDADAALDERGKFEVAIMRAISNVGHQSSSAPVRTKGSFL